ncbi:MAG: T9SS type A sorting domain-containing protein [Bacteroidia bacterium]
MEVFPNPVHDQLIVKFNDEKTHELSFYNALGTKLWQATEIQKEVQIPVNQYPKGVYFVKEGKNLQKILVD